MMTTKIRAVKAENNKINLENKEKQARIAEVQKIKMEPTKKLTGRRKRKKTKKRRTNLIFMMMMKMRTTI